MISYARTRRRHGTKITALAVALVLAALALLIPAAASPSSLTGTTTTLVQPVRNDTLLASEWVQAIIDDWRPDRSLFFCLVRHAEWETLTFILDLRETSAEEKCSGPQPVFAQLPTCPPMGTKFAGTQRYIIVQCGPGVIRKYRSLGEINMPKTMPMERT